MSGEFKVEIVNPEKSFLVKEDVFEVVVPAYEGEMGILKDHISIISFSASKRRLFNLLFSNSVVFTIKLVKMDKLLSLNSTIPSSK